MKSSQYLFTIRYVISGFRREVDAFSALLAYYVAYSGNSLLVKNYITIRCVISKKSVNLTLDVFLGMRIIEKLVCSIPVQFH